MHLEIIGLLFAIMFVAELPDKSMFATLILSTRMPALWVWLGAATAFLAHVIIAVSAGRLLTLLPHRAEEAVVAILFLAGAALVFFGRHGLEDAKKEAPKMSKAQAHKFWKVFATTFGMVFIGEWGDITQITTANYAAKYHDTFNVAVGATLGLWAVTGLGIVVGGRALASINPKILQRVIGFMLLGFGILSAISAVS